jgi:hypothetical protein
MIRTILKVGAMSLLIAAMAGLTMRLPAQESTNTAPAQKTTATEKKPVSGPFHGKLAALDKNAKTITVGKRTFQITSETKILKAGNPATLEDGVLGEEVSGYVKPSEDGKLVATKVNFGAKAQTKSPEKKKGNAETK